MTRRPSDLPTVKAPTITYKEASAEIRSRTSAERLLQTHTLAEVLEDAAKVSQ